MAYTEYMEDCIHLKACRRLNKIARNNGHSFTRNCTATCNAYSGAVSPECEFIMDIYGGYRISKCPNCGEELNWWGKIFDGEVINENPVNYCPVCGQKITWEGIE